MNTLKKYVIAVAKRYGFVEEGDLILWGKVERMANSGLRDLDEGRGCGSKREVAILLMALKEEEESERHTKREQSMMRIVHGWNQWLDLLSDVPSSCQRVAEDTRRFLAIELHNERNKRRLSPAQVKSFTDLMLYRGTLTPDEPVCIPFKLVEREGRTCEWEGCDLKATHVTDEVPTRYLCIGHYTVWDYDRTDPPKGDD